MIFTMKRDRNGHPIIVMHRWNRPPLSCGACREKKRRCDRAQPCSNCVQRNISCEYSGQSSESTEDLKSFQKPTCGEKNQPALARPIAVPASPSQNNDLVNRIEKLENYVFRNHDGAGGLGPSAQRVSISLRSNMTTISQLFTAFGSHSQPVPNYQTMGTDIDAEMIDAIKQLPPIGQARELFDHFVKRLHPTFGILHIPSTRTLMEESYQGMLNGEQPSPTNLMLLFSIFSGAALVSSPQLLQMLNATQAEARAAFDKYSQLALSILEHPLQPVQPSTAAIIAIGTLAHLLTNREGLSIKISLLKTRCLLMARTMQIHRLDTAQSQEERRRKGCNLVEIEVQRRFWWNMVASDWLSGFSGSPQEGAYVFQPRHMNVNYPANIDDDLMEATGAQQAFPLSAPTVISGSIQRVKLANLCREVVDAMPSILLDSQEPDYEVILALDKKFHEYLEEIPEFFKLDKESIQKSQEICEERPYIAWQRINLHFSFHTRLCRLHRPYHLEGVTNPKYAYSHMVCIRSAQTVLELRRAMDDIDPEAGWYPARFWRVMQHVFLAALTLATDVSFNPDAPDAEARKAKVLAAYKTLEKSKEDSGSLVEGVQKNMQTLLSTLQKQGGSLAGSKARPVAPRDTGLNGALISGPNELSMTNQVDNSSDTQAGLIMSGALTDDIGEDGWQQLWSEFVAVAPDLDVPQWNSLLDDVDFGWLENNM